MLSKLEQAENLGFQLSTLDVKLGLGRPGEI